MANRTIAIRKSRKPWLRRPWYYVILAENGEPTGPSQMYTRKESALDEANRTATATFIVRDET